MQSSLLHLPLTVSGSRNTCTNRFLYLCFCQINLLMNHLRLVFVILFPLGSLCLYSCENNIATVTVITAPDKTPLAVEENANIVYTDSARTKLRLLAPIIERYGGTDP